MKKEQELDMSEGAGIRTAVDIMVLNEKNQVLLGQHIKAGREVWGFPGGHQKTGETIKQTALRELNEETGKNHRIELTNHIVAVRENCLPPWFVPHITIVLLAHFTQGDIIVTEPHRTLAWKWFSLTQLPENLYSGIGDIFTAYMKNSVQVVTDWHSPEEQK